jgi:hypothetical protein
MHLAHNHAITVVPLFPEQHLRQVSDCLVRCHGVLPMVCCKGVAQAAARAGVKVILSSLQGDYLASQASWSSIFTEEMMPENLTAAEQKFVSGHFQRYCK